MSSSTGLRRNPSRQQFWCILNKNGSLWCNLKYQIHNAAVNWYGIISKSYTLRAGVRQGGVLSPNLFSIYVDMVISAIDGSNLGCQIGTQNMGILMYADDLVLVSASVCKLQKMVSICVDVLRSLDLKINIKKHLYENWHTIQIRVC